MVILVCLSKQVRLSDQVFCSMSMIIFIKALATFLKKK